MTELHDRIDGLVKSDRVVLFMKGTRAAPQCGFSAQVVEILDQHLGKYTTVNVLADAEIREGVKAYAQWPTIPQLFIDGEFVGGCDIVRQMDETGALVQVLGDLVLTQSTPQLTITDAAARAFGQAAGEIAPGESLRLAIDRSFAHDLTITTVEPGDVTVVANGVSLVLDPRSARRADGVRIDYVEQPVPGFKIDNPNAPPSVRPLQPKEAQALVHSEPRLRFIDVRTPAEHERARIPGATLLDEATMAQIMALPRDTPLLLHCHHGHRSRQAAMHFLDEGFTHVCNLEGGIDAWSREIDKSIPRY
ncbi:MAG: Grx4 family monothiol glutaredoxin [Nannocystaceae bacterium]|nr:Grx4 family monothiol glutaredoxin [Nannocystaceae bacterium]